MSNRIPFSFDENLRIQKELDVSTKELEEELARQGLKNPLKPDEVKPKPQTALSNVSPFSYETDKQAQDTDTITEELPEVHNKTTMIQDYNQDLQCLFCNFRTIKPFHISCPYLKQGTCTKETNTEPH